MIFNIVFALLTFATLMALNVLTAIMFIHRANWRNDEMFFIALSIIIMFLATQMRIDYAIKKANDAKETCNKK